MNSGGSGNGGGDGGSGKGNSNNKGRPSFRAPREVGRGCFCFDPHNNDL